MDIEDSTPPTIEDLLETWSVMAPGMWENDIGPKDWYAVCNDNGIKAYFGDEAAAFAFRLMMINMALNGVECAKLGSEGR